MNERKITVKIQTGLLKNFERDMRDRFLKRDAFLNQIVNVEVGYLLAELKDKKMSPFAKRYVAGCLKRMGTTPVNIVIDREVADRLDEAVENSNMVRDSFFNYLLICLRSTDNFLKYFELPEYCNSSTFNAVLPPISVSPLRVLSEVMCDPFLYLRQAVQERYEEGLYTMYLPEQFHGFSCYLPDIHVPGTEANIDWMAEMDEVLSGLDFDQLDKEAFSKKGTKK
jgi:hypothetical protein